MEGDVQEGKGHHGLLMIEKIISGGQTGVDQAGLDFAIENGIPHGGTCPKGRLSEAGPIPSCYQLTESFAATYPPRTQTNVEDSDATVIFPVNSIGLESGCLLTASLCKQGRKPFLVIRLDDADEEGNAKELRDWIEEHQVRILNVAGARGSRQPDVGRVKRILAKAILR
jgi:hypothetical protein